LFESSVILDCPLIMSTGLIAILITDIPQNTFL
jgi:hypothetical protein